MTVQKQEQKKTKSIKQPIKALLIMDWDNTIIAGHSHNLIYKLHIFYTLHPTTSTSTAEKNSFIDEMVAKQHFPSEPRKSLFDWMSAYEKTHDKPFGLNDETVINSIHALIPTIRKADQWNDLFVDWTKASGGISYNSFSAFKPSLSNYLTHNIGLAPEIHNQIHIEQICNSEQGNKTRSILSAIKYFQTAHGLPDGAPIIFCDDSSKNIRAAEAQINLENFTTIQAHADGRHLPLLFKELTLLKKIPAAKADGKKQTSKLTPPSMKSLHITVPKDEAPTSTPCAFYQKKERSNMKSLTGPSSSFFNFKLSSSTGTPPSTSSADSSPSQNSKFARSPLQTPLHLSIPEEPPEIASKEERNFSFT